MLISADCHRCCKPIEFERVGRPQIYCEPCRPQAQKEQMAAWRAKHRPKKPPKPPAPRKPAPSEVARQAVVASRRALGCETCGGVVTPPRHRFCSKRCSTGVPPAIYIDLDCPECRVNFRQKKISQRFCSWKCGKRHSDRISTKARRARAAEGDIVNPIEVFERDGWRCQLCSCKTPRSLMGKLIAGAPTLDHIKPISKGGAHTYQNTQCACWPCNAKKGAREIGQLRLF